MSNAVNVLIIILVIFVVFSLSGCELKCPPSGEKYTLQPSVDKDGNLNLQREGYDYDYMYTGKIIY
jgi:predicted small lipoprotein YifL